MEKDNGLIVMPERFREKFFSVCTEPCDFIEGPCACGTWHKLKDWPEEVRESIGKEK
ncbi:hypothetical protein LCGC14_1374100 [marine sediment metagenome]|uniref:Uncharacterized protein n=1 Tax=marine sediment metagenome TaxID=412755 RepID=A0A0F9N6J3_9ZZZZ